VDDFNTDLIKNHFFIREFKHQECLFIQFINKRINKHFETNQVFFLQMLKITFFFLLHLKVFLKNRLELIFIKKEQKIMFFTINFGFKNKIYVFSLTSNPIFWI